MNGLNRAKLDMKSAEFLVEAFVMNTNESMDRREFLTRAGTTAAAISAGLLQTQSAEPDAANTPKPKREQVIGFQIGAVSFMDEGTEKVLDILQEQGRVNTLFLATFTYGNGIAGRQLSGHPFPDHGVRD
jgi:hypothetical protein